MFENLFSERGLSIERLYALIRLEESGSLIRAAGGDKGRQSRYSHYLRELSAFFGVELTSRVGKSVRLSPAGKQLAQIAQEHFQSLLQFKENIHKEPNEFRLGAEDGLLQRLVIPVVGSMRRADHSFRLSVQSHQTADTVSMLLAQRLDFGLIEAKAAPAALKRILVHTLTPAVVVPERIVPQRGLLTLKTALFDCPHAVVGSDDQLVQIINELAREMSKQFRPELVCDSVAQCMTAVRSGYYAALLPLQLWVPDSRFPCHVVEDSFLDGLKQSIALVWHPRLIDVSGRAAIRIKDALVAAVRGFSAAP